MPLPPAFADTGLHIQRATDTPITRFQVLGERSSGTNFVKRLLGRNTDLKPTEALGWKHGHPHMMAVPHDLAVICVVRNAQTWAQSMFAKPWHTTPAMQALAFSDFIRHDWDTIIDRPRYFDGLVPDGATGAPLQQDRNPETGARYANLFALRTGKLASLLSVTARDCTCMVVRMEAAQSAPEDTLHAICAGLDLPAPTAAFRPVIKRLGSKFKPALANRHPGPAEWDAADLAHLHAHTDAALEAQLGYTY